METFLLLSGDFNAKVGQFTEGDNSIGKYSKGRRNENGKTLLELCESENLFITNSAFPHPSSHTTTWVGQRRDPHTKKINLSQRQKELRIKINTTNEDNKKIELEKERNETLHQIRKKVTQLRNEELNKQEEAISSAQTDDVMFSAVKALNRGKFENPKVEDSEGKLITNPNEILKTVANHFENKFKDINTP